MSEKVKLSGGPKKTVTWIWLDDHGQLKVELYDFSEMAQQMIGNDIASTITVNEMDQLLSAAKQSATSLIPWLTQNFKSYFGVKKWLEENEVDFGIEKESWA
jgi:hypothetical protein